MTERSAPSDQLETRWLSPLEDLLRPDVFRALADPTRLEILKRLITAPEPWTVGEVASCCGVHLSGVSRHLAVLRDAGILSAEKRGREVLYGIESEPITQALRDLADAIDACRRDCCATESTCGPSCGPQER